MTLVCQWRASRTNPHMEWGQCGRERARQGFYPVFPCYHFWTRSDEAYIFRTRSHESVNVRGKLPEQLSRPFATSQITFRQDCSVFRESDETLESVEQSRELGPEHRTPRTAFPPSCAVYQVLQCGMPTNATTRSQSSGRVNPIPISPLCASAPAAEHTVQPIVSPSAAAMFRAAPSAACGNHHT